MANERPHMTHTDQRQGQLEELAATMEAARDARHIWRINGVGAWALYWVLIDADMHAWVKEEPVSGFGLAATVLTGATAVGALSRALYLGREISRNSAQAQALREDLALWPPLEAIPADAEPIDPNTYY